MRYHFVFIDFMILNNIPGVNFLSLFLQDLAVSSDTYMRDRDIMQERHITLEQIWNKLTQNLNIRFKLYAYVTDINI
jgi:hypothetical protein